MIALEKIHGIVKENYVNLFRVIFVWHLLDIMISYVGIFIFNIHERNPIFIDLFEKGFFWEASIASLLIIFISLCWLNSLYEYVPDSKHMKILSLTIYIGFWLGLFVVLGNLLTIIGALL